MVMSLAELAFYWSSWSLPFSERYWVNTACSLLVGVVCGVLGCFVVLRRMALIGDALSHAVLPGVVVAFLVLGYLAVDVGSPGGAIGLMAGALAAGMLTSFLVSFVSRRARTKEDSAIGIVFTALFALGVILISALPRSTHFDLKCFLFGEPLAVSGRDLVMLGIVATVVLAWVVLFYHPLKLVSFDPTLAQAMGLPVAGLHYLLMGFLSLTVVAGLTTVGVIMVVAMVVTPASAAYQLTNRFRVMLVLAAVFGAVSAVAGLVLAFVINAPTGPSMVLVAAVIFGLAVLLSPSHGVLAESLRRARLSRHYATEDLVKAIHKLREHGTPSTVQAVAAEARLTPRRITDLVTQAGGAALVENHQGTLCLTVAGEQRAAEMTRAHRLWESYLAQEARLPPDQLHEQAHRLEHAHELADELDKDLGHPQHGPHGEVIPPKVEGPSS